MDMRIEEELAKCRSVATPDVIQRTKEMLEEIMQLDKGTVLQFSASLQMASTITGSGYYSICGSLLMAARGGLLTSWEPKAKKQEEPIPTLWGDV